MNDDIYQRVAKGRGWKISTKCIACGTGMMQGDQECPWCGELQVLSPGVTAEMVRSVREHECNVYGHDWQIVKTIEGAPKAVVCGRCRADSRLKRCGCGH